MLNEPHGGIGARVYVLHPPAADRQVSGPFTDRLNTRADALAKKTGTTVEVGGPGATFLDYDRFTSERILWLISRSRS